MTNASADDEVFVSSGSGIIRTISISKTIKMIPSKKNRSENGIRAVFLGSNPHSNGDVFSRSDSEREFRIQAARNVTPASAHEVIKAVVSRFMN